ncbi:MAG: DUF6541 family protein [Candidatus Aminicenantes bacterium]
MSLAFEVIKSTFFALFLYVLPGLALLSLFWRGEKLSWGIKLGLSSALGVALYPILFLWTYVMGLAPGPLFAWTPGIIAVFVLIWHFRKSLTRIPARLAEKRSFGFNKENAVNLVFLVVIGLLLGTRLAAVRGMAAPSWGDSVHHTFIVQLILDNGGLFHSWEPYAPFQSFTYHFGFHADVAVWAWISGVSAPQAVLAAGQILNVLAVLALYPLAVRLGGSRWAGIGAMVIAGLLSPMPAFYVNWGRYPQLVSQVVLPVGIWFFDVWWSSEERPRSQVLVLFFIFLSGISLIHYSMTFILGMAAVSWALWGLWQRRKDLIGWLSRTLQFGGISLISALSIVPWVIMVKKGRIPMVFKKMSVSGEESYITGDVFLWKNTDLYFSDLFWMFGLAALFLALLACTRIGIPVALWAGLSFLVTNPYLVGMHGPGWVTNFALIIALYIPISLVLGWLLGAGWNGLWRYKGGRILALASLLLILILGSWRQMRVVDPFFQTVEPTDIEAFAWIKKNVPQEALFLVNGFLVFDESTVVGSDAGWWLPYYTLRANTVPPVVYTLETVKPEVDNRSFTRIASLIETSRGDPARLRSILCQEGVTHVYLGEKRGRVGYGAEPLVLEKWLEEISDFTLIYQNSRAQVWHFDRSLCPQEPRGQKKN